MDDFLLIFQQFLPNFHLVMFQNILILPLLVVFYNYCYIQIYAYMVN